MPCGGLKHFPLESMLKRWEGAALQTALLFFVSKGYFFFTAIGVKCHVAAVKSISVLPHNAVFNLYFSWIIELILVVRKLSSTVI